VDGSTTSVVVPSGVPEPGRHYYIELQAIRAEGFDVSDRPLMLIDRVVQSAATTTSGLLSVPDDAP